MATITRYVDYASAGGDGTTAALTGANAAYASMAAWNTAEATDLVTDGDSHIVYWRGTGSNVADWTLSFANWTTGAGNTLTVEVPTDSFTGIPGGGPRIERGANYNAAVFLDKDYVTLRRVEARNTNNNNAHAIECSLSTPSSVIDGCIVSGGTTTTCRGITEIRSNMTISNTLIWDCGGAPFKVNNYSAPTFVNCTWANNGAGPIIGGTQSDPVGINCVAYNNTTSNFSSGWAAGSTYNAASDGSTTTPPGTNAITTDVVSGDFEDAANDDFHLASGSALDDAGVGTTNSDVPSIDIDGDSRGVTTTGIGIDAAPPVTTETHTITAGVGSLSLAGVAPAVEHNQAHYIAAAVGALALAGIAPTTDHNVVETHSVTAGVGSLSLSGAAPTVEHTVVSTHTATIAAGSLSLTGAAPSVEHNIPQNHAVSAQVGALAMSGVAPSTLATTGVSHDATVAVGALRLGQSGTSPVTQVMGDAEAAALGDLSAPQITSTNVEGPQSVTLTWDIVDTIGPVITLTGGPVTLDLGQRFIEPGFAASDDVDGDVTVDVVVSGVVNTSQAGDYVLSYDAQDEARNAATTQQRVVTVLPDDTEPPPEPEPEPDSDITEDYVYRFPENMVLAKQRRVPRFKQDADTVDVYWIDWNGVRTTAPTLTFSGATAIGVTYDAERNRSRFGIPVKRDEILVKAKDETGYTVSFVVFPDNEREARDYA